MEPYGDSQFQTIELDKYKTNRQKALVPTMTLGFKHERLFRICPQSSRTNFGVDVFALGREGTILSTTVMRTLRQGRDECLRNRPVIEYSKSLGLCV